MDGWMDGWIDGWMDTVDGWLGITRYTTRTLHGSYLSIYLSKVKNAVEQSYQCLGITCIEVGGLWNPNNGTGAYRTSASPCVDSASTFSRRPRHTTGPHRTPAG